MCFSAKYMAGTGSGQVEVGGSREKYCCHWHLVAKLCLLFGTRPYGL